MIIFIAAISSGQKAMLWGSHDVSSGFSPAAGNHRSNEGTTRAWVACWSIYLGDHFLDVHLSDFRGARFSRREFYTGNSNFRIFESVLLFMYIHVQLGTEIGYLGFKADSSPHGLWDFELPVQSPILAWSYGTPPHLAGKNPVFQEGNRSLA